jgi:hypothetical protein
LSGEAFNLFRAQRRILRSRLPGLVQLVGLHLCDYWSEKRPRVFPSMSLLARRCRLDRKTVMAAITALKEAGAVGIIESGPGRGYAYDLTGIMVLEEHADRSDTRTGPHGVLVHETDRSTTGTGSSPPDGQGVVHETDTIDPRIEANRLKPSLPRSEAAAVRGSRSRSNAKGKPEKPRPGRGKITEVYFACYHREHGVDPVFDSLDGRAVNTLWDKTKGDVDRACSAIEAAFKSFRKENVTIQDIAKNPAAFAPGSSGKNQKVQHAPLDALADLGTKPTKAVAGMGGT